MDLDFLLRYDNRPLNLKNLKRNINQIVFVSATPALMKQIIQKNIAEQIIRPTGLLDPEIIIRPVKGANR